MKTNVENPEEHVPFNRDVELFSEHTGAVQREAAATALHS